MTTNRWTACAAALAAGLVCCGGASAEDWPTRPVTMIVPYAPGGNIDQAARVFGRELSEKLGQQFIVESKGGAGGSIGAAQVAKSKPDGYTLLVTANGPSVLNKMLYASLPYDPDTDFTPISLISDVPQVFIVNPKSPVGDLKGLVALAKAEEGRADDRPSGRRHRRASDGDLVCQPRRHQRHSGGLSRRPADRHGGARRRDRRRPAGLYPAGAFHQGHRRHLGASGSISCPACRPRARAASPMCASGPSPRSPRRPARRREIVTKMNRILDAFLKTDEAKKQFATARRPHARRPARAPDRTDEPGKGALGSDRQKRGHQAAMIEKHIDIATADGRMDSFVVHPEEGGPFPAVARADGHLGAARGAVRRRAQASPPSAITSRCRTSGTGAARCASSIATRTAGCARSSRCRRRCRTRCTPT